MRRLLFLILLISLNINAFAQDEPRPTASRFYQNKLSGFKVKQGDILLYSMKKDTFEYKLIVTIKKYGPVINFDYSIPEKNIKANVNIQSTAVTDAVTYDTDFTGHNKDLNDKSSIWLSKKSYTELSAVGETEIDMGNGSESFERKSTTTYKIIYKGKEKIITAYKAQPEEGKNKRMISVLTSKDNPVIVSMDTGWLITLKEVR